MNKKLQNRELKLNNIDVYERDLRTSKALTINIDNKYYIGIKKGYNEAFNFWLIEHELEHIKNKTFYKPDADSYTINKMERITNDAVVLKNGITSSILVLQKKGLSKEEICEKLEIPFELYDHAIEVINRKLLTLVSKNIKNL